MSDLSPDPASVFRRFSAAPGSYRAVVGTPSGSGWLTWAEASSQLFLRAEVDRLCQRDGGSSHVGARFLLGWLSGVVAAPHAWVALTTHRLLAPPAESLAVHCDSNGWFDALAVDDPELLVVEGPGVHAAVADACAALLSPAIDRLVELTGRGRRALWATAADQLAAGYLSAGQATGDVDGARQGADAGLSAATSPLRTTIEWLEVAHSRGTHLSKRRSVCCLAYQAERFADQFCATCPLVSVDETTQRLRAWLDG